MTNDTTVVGFFVGLLFLMVLSALMVTLFDTETFSTITMGQFIYTFWGALLITIGIILSVLLVLLVIVLIFK